MHVGNVVDRIILAHAKLSDHDMPQQVMATGAESWSRGMCMTCLIFPEFVVKWVGRDGTPYHDTAGEDHVLVSTVHDDDKDFFPVTEYDRGFIIQERVTPLALLDDIASPEYIVETMIRLAIRYNLKDLHGNNIGFRKNDNITPVIFDMSGRCNHIAEWYQRGRPDVDHAAAVIRDRLNLPWISFSDMGYSIPPLKSLAFELIRHHLV